MILINFIGSFLERTADESNAIFYLIFSSLFLRFLLEICGQKWIRTISHTATLIILPIITFVITTIISGNIALSLGMVGALSIVRFRNPVRSPLELSVYFAAITMGITAAVRINMVIFLIYSIVISTIILFLISLISKKLFNRQFFEISFSEGNSLSTLEISAKNIEILDNSKFLKSKRVINSKIIYLLASYNFNLLRKLSKDLEEDENINDYQLNQ